MKTLLVGCWLCWFVVSGVAVDWTMPDMPGFGLYDSSGFLGPFSAGVLTDDAAHDPSNPIVLAQSPDDAAALLGSSPGSAVGYVFMSVAGGVLGSVVAIPPSGLSVAWHGSSWAAGSHFGTGGVIGVAPFIGSGMILGGASYVATNSPSSVTGALVGSVLGTMDGVFGVGDEILILVIVFVLVKVRLGLV